VNAEPSAEASDIGLFMNEIEQSDDEADNSEDDEMETMMIQQPRLNMQPQFRPDHPMKIHTVH
jgi:hypothetical protein